MFRVFFFLVPVRRAMVLPRGPFIRTYYCSHKQAQCSQAHVNYVRVFDFIQERDKIIVCRAGLFSAPTLLHVIVCELQ